MKPIVVISLVLGLLSNAAFADTLRAARTIRSNTILTAADVIVEKNANPSAFSKPSDVIGMEARVILYEGRPISRDQIGPAAVIQRNEIVTLVFLRGSLLISTEARSLGRAGVGDTLKVMNIASRTSLTGTVDANGNVVVDGLGQ
ncbi:MAG: flagellar basal body P-ring formation chaperone FlgA [Marinosulfonomonas sp.]